jgi:diguanylate cyclase (GGDEF)-like protein
MPIRFKDFLFSIRSRVGAFSLLATLLPSITLGWLSYDRNASVLREKAGHEIVAAGAFAAQDIDAWLKDWIQNLRVVGSSHLITENLERLSGAGRGNSAKGMQDYLRSVGSRFTGLASLRVAAVDGQLITGAEKGKVPEEWLTPLNRNQVVIGEPRWNAAAQAVTVPMAIPIRSARGQAMGSIVAELDASPIDRIIERKPLDDGAMYIVDGRGVRITSGKPAAPDAAPIPSFALLASDAEQAREYRNAQGESVVGALRRIPDAQWGVVAERRSDVVFGQVYALRNLTVALVLGLLAAVGVGAYWIGLTLVRPLDRLVGAADKVASGDLDVTLPVARRDELGHLTESFNKMTSQLLRNREALAAANEELLRKNIELQAISITDALTGLFNRRYLMDVLDRVFSQHARNGRTFTLLMADLDHFKKINDKRGHPAGDAVLVQAGKILREEIRSGDYAARFGGEEFTLLLMDTGVEDARQIAERIRARFEQSAIEFGGKPIPVTVSIGLAQVADNAQDTVTALIARADAALYAAKHGGRNTVRLHEELPS